MKIRERDMRFVGLKVRRVIICEECIEHCVIECNNLDKIEYCYDEECCKECDYLHDYKYLSTLVG